jgi:hypothetical protein
MLNYCKLHKNKPGSFFAHNHFEDLLTNCAINSKTFSDPPQADQAQYKHTHSLKFKLTDPLRGQIDALFFPAIMQSMTQDGGVAEVVSSPPSATSAAAETDTEAWLGDPDRSYAS